MINSFCFNEKGGNVVIIICYCLVVPRFNPLSTSMYVQDLNSGIIGSASGYALNSSPPGQKGHHFGRQYFDVHFIEWKCFISD